MSEGTVDVKRALPNFSSFFLPFCHVPQWPGLLEQHRTPVRGFLAAFFFTAPKH